uniref:Uncharacterized protein n=1 Tax=Leersia perrieri TaxID=77586 RepID=A0A0D9WLS3_9ORYZ
MDRHGTLTKLGFGALTCNSVLAIYRSRGDPSAVAFVAAAYAAIVLLFYFLRRFELAGRDQDRRRTKVAVWLLTTLLTVLFASRVAPLMPTIVGFGVWFMAAGTTVAGFKRAGQAADRGRIKAVVWVLMTILMAMFAGKVALLMPPLIAVLVWFMSTATFAGGFWAFFLSR